MSPSVRQGKVLGFSLENGMVALGPIEQPFISCRVEHVT